MMQVSLKLQSKIEDASQMESVQLNFQDESGTHVSMRVANSAKDLVTVGKTYTITVTDPEAQTVAPAAPVAAEPTPTEGGAS